MSNEVYQIKIGSRKVGPVGLGKIFTEIRERRLKSTVQLKAELLRRARRNNYTAVSAEHEYREAIYGEYRRFLGETVTEDQTMLEIRVLGPGCRRCEELERLAKNAVAEMALAANVQHVRDLKEISKYGHSANPGLVINGEVVTAGKVPSLSELKRLLTEKQGC